MIDMESKLKWAIKVFLSEYSKRGVFDINHIVDDIMSHAKYGTAFNSGKLIMDVAYEVTVAYFRHKWTNYDELIRKSSGIDYRGLANNQARRQIRRWKKGKKDLVVKDIRH